MNNICKNCIHWERLTVASYYREYFVTDEPTRIYKEYESYGGIPWWGTAITDQYLGNLPQNIGSCSCDNFIKDSPETPNPRKILDQNKGALYYCDGENYSCWFYTGENFACRYFKAKTCLIKHST
jgi:hypothetical protein